VRLSLLTLLACPDCRSELELVQGDPVSAGVVITGVLECTGCRRTFTIQRRIPRLLPRHLDAAQKQEMSARDDQVEMYDANIPLLAFGLVEVPYTVHCLDINPAHTLLEAGCGTGRMTTKLAGLVTQLVSVDFSVKSLIQNELKVQTAGCQNVHLIQADICHLPLKDSYFDRAVSCQVLEHIPTAELREKGVGEITRTVKPGGRVVISAYQHSRWTKDKSGEHDGGIPYFRFTEDELRQLLETSLEVKLVSGALIYLFVASCFRPFK
jgi:ubiquinone/menaquinone biosynthesis C-methylase UbiE